MSTHDPLPTPHCARVAPLLPLLDTGLDADDAAFAHDHLRGCVYCRARLEEYASLDRALQRRYGLASLARRPTEEIMQHITNRDSTQTTPRPPRRGRLALPSGRAFLGGLGAVASVLALIGLALMLFGGRLFGSGPGANPGPARPSFPGTQGLFASIAMVSPTEGWALGQVTKTAQGERPLDEVTFYHFQSGAWTPTHVKTSKDFSVGGVSGFSGTISMDSPTDGWADVHNFNQVSTLLHYANGAWSEVAAPEVWRVQALGPKSVWAIMQSQDAGGRANLAHYDGATWTPQSFTDLPSDATPRPTDFHMLSASAGWALVNLSDDTHSNYAVVRYSGGAWTMHSTFSAGEFADFGAFAMLSPTEGWALGQKIVANSFGITTHVPLKQLLYHYSGGKWAEVALPVNTSDYVTLTRIVMLSPANGWIVGTEQRTYPGSTTSDFQRRVVLLQYANGRWTSVQAPPTGVAAEEMTDLAFTSDGAGWACGYLSDIPPADTVQDSDILKRATPELWTFHDGGWAAYQP
jgi:hypothetical protein